MGLRVYAKGPVETILNVGFRTSLSSPVFRKVPRAQTTRSILRVTSTTPTMLPLTPISTIGSGTSLSKNPPTPAKIKRSKGGNIATLALSVLLLVSISTVYQKFEPPHSLTQWRYGNKRVEIEVEVGI